jgi:hypothetical protein
LKKIIIAFCAVASLALSGCCNGPGDYWEPKTYGVRNSNWQQMSAGEQDAVARTYNENLRVAEQMKLNALKQKQMKQLAKAQRKSAAAQSKRLKKELAHLKQEQDQNVAKIDGLVNTP